MSGTMQHTGSFRVIAYALILSTVSLAAHSAPSGTPFDQLHAQITTLSQQLNQTNAELTTLSTQISQSTLDASNLTNQIISLQSQASATADQLAALTALAGQSTADVNVLASQIAALSSNLVSLSRRVDGLASNIVSIFDQLDSTNSRSLHFVISYPTQQMALDHAFRPADPGCQATLLCSSWQAITGGDFTRFVLSDRTKLLMTFTGNYNWDGNGSTVSGGVFTSSAIDIYPATGPIPPLQEPSWGLDWRWIANGGVNANFRKIVTLEPGEYIVRAKHRYQFQQNEVSYFTAWTFFNGVLTLEGIE